MCKKLIQETAKDVLRWKDIRTVDQMQTWPCYYLNAVCLNITQQLSLPRNHKYSKGA